MKRIESLNNWKCNYRTLAFESNKAIEEAEAEEEGKKNNNSQLKTKRWVLILNMAIAKYVRIRCVWASRYQCGNLC